MTSVTNKNSTPLSAAPSLGAEEFSAVRRRVMLDGCKWDPQVGDTPVLLPFPLVLRANEWRRLAQYAEQLAAEADLAETEILQRPDLLARLGLPRALWEALTGATPLTPAAGQIRRFDFHWTTEGWRLSEANSDVPGGFTEASYFTALMAAHYPDLQAAGDPAAVWSDALAAVCGKGGEIAFLSAPGYMEDHQIIAFLAARLRERGCRTQLAKPEQIIWHEGEAHLETSWHRGALGAVVRFYQAEWIARLPSAAGWRYFFRGGKTRVANPASGVISESKRFPLVWQHLETELPTWRALLPETRDPREAPRGDEGWLLKRAFCNTGDAVSARDWMAPADWRWTELSARLCPSRWVAQRRFESVPIATPAGLRHVCIGVYTVNGAAAGAYTRVAKKPLIDFEATDAALLLEEDE